MRALVIGAGLAGLAAAERLLDHGARVTVVDSFPVPGGRTASFDVPVPVAGLVAVAVDPLEAPFCQPSGSSRGAWLPSNEIVTTEFRRALPDRLLVP